LYDELTTRAVSALLLVATGLGAGWQVLKVSRKPAEPSRPSQVTWVDPTRPVTLVRDFLLLLSLGLVFAVIVSPRMILDNALELRFSFDSVIQSLGIILVASGSVLAAWALRTLGEFATERISLSENHRLVETGPYRLVRHPMYGSTLLLGLGLFLLYLNITFLVIGIAVFLINDYRANVEERLLSSPEGFGERYVEYRKRTRRFIPYIF
jgi:protein-S-isoprenylcysteine O-methyltransferase Ste14